MGGEKKKRCSTCLATQPTTRQHAFIMFVPVITLLIVTSSLSGAEEMLHKENVNSLQGANANEGACQINSALNTLLVKMLLSAQPQLLQQPKQFSNAKDKTTVVTSSVVSTVTRRIPKVLSIWFRNERIPTTIFATTTQLVTDIVTATSVIVAAPTDLVHDLHKRQVTLLQSSFPESDEDSSGTSATSILDASTISEELVSQILTQPIVTEAFANLLAAIQLTAGDQLKNKHDF